MKFNPEFLGAYVVTSDGKAGTIKRLFTNTKYYGIHVKGEENLREIHASNLEIVDEYVLSQKD